MDQTNAVVIIPTYNERQTIARIVPSVLSQQANLPERRLNVLVVDGLSTDGTIEFVTEIGHDDDRVHLLLVPRRGLGVALTTAYDHTFNVLRAGLVGQIDADLSHEPRHLPAMFKALLNGYDLAIGFRYVEGGGARGRPVSCRVLSLAANSLIRALTGHWEVHEWTSGYRAFTADLYRRLDLASISYADYTIQPALIYEAVRLGARVKEVPILFSDRRWGKSKLPMLSYSLNLVRHFLGARRRQSVRQDQPWPVRLPD
jgi:dolichol-phosphate mannosyltransferase